MAERYRDARGHFVSPSALGGLAAYMRESYGAGRKTTERERVERREPEPPPPPAPPTNWGDTAWKGGGTVRHADGSPLSPDAFVDFPEGHTGFQVRFIIPDNPDYPRGWASYSYVDSGEWERIDAILQDGADEFGATGEPDDDGVVRTGVGAIIFYETPPAHRL